MVAKVVMHISIRLVEKCQNKTYSCLYVAQLTIVKMFKDKEKLFRTKSNLLHLVTIACNCYHWKQSLSIYSWR